MDYTLALICTLIGVVGVIYSIIIANVVKGAPAGNEKMNEIAGAIKEGAIAYLNRQMRSMGIAGIIIFIVIFATMGAKTAIGFALGAIASFLAGYIGMRVSVLANVRTAEAAKSGMAAGLSMAFKGGSVTGMIVAGLALTSVAGYYTFTHDVIALVALGFGGSLISIFARLGGGIFTKGADVGADLVGKVEAGIPEDDPRNPAVIADNVGDNVGDVAGMGADLFESYIGSIVGSMILGVAFLANAGHEGDLSGVMLPLVIAGVGIVVSIIGTFFVRTSEGGNPQTALNVGTIGAAVLMALPSLMILLSLTLKARANRLVNIVVGIFHIFVLLGTQFVGESETWFYWRINELLQALYLALIIWTAWKWPKQEA